MEEKLKKFKKSFIFTQIRDCVFIFLLFYPLAFGILDYNSWVKADIALIVVLLTVGFLTRKNAQKKQAETLAVMPMIISIKDTVESLKKERLFYNTVYVIMFVFGLTFLRSGSFRLLSCIALALSSLFIEFAKLTTQKIKYLESKPEGL